jgi:hypothetical protein
MPAPVATGGMPAMSGPLARLLRRRLSHAWQACERCHSAFVCPIEWDPADGEHWLITTRCGQCGVWQRLTLTNAQAAAWDLQLDAQTQPIQRAARRLDSERMAAEADAFIAALAHDLIDAADFA